MLLRHAAGLSREELFLHPDAVLAREAGALFAQLVAGRAAGCPTAYLVGSREFYGVDLRVDARVLIPRPETEVLVEAVCEALGEVLAPVIVEVGTGSGAVAVALARTLSRAHIVATDRSLPALDVARENARRHGVAGRITWVAGDALEALAGMGLEGAVHGVCANPPYIPTAEWERLPREVRDFEPREALDGGPDGLAVHRRIISGCGRYLRPGGVLALEIGTRGQAREVAALAEATGIFGTPRVVSDYAGAERVVVARRRGDGCASWA